MQNQMFNTTHNFSRTCKKENLPTIFDSGKGVVFMDLQKKPLSLIALTKLWKDIPIPVHICLLTGREPINKVPLLLLYIF